MAAAKFAAVQQDFERVKAELVKMMDKYNAQHRKSADHKLAMKNKVHSIKLVAFRYFVELVIIKKIYPLI